MKNLFYLLDVFIRKSSTVYVTPVLKGVENFGHSFFTHAYLKFSLYAVERARPELYSNLIQK